MLGFCLGFFFIYINFEPTQRNQLFAMLVVNIKKDLSSSTFPKRELIPKY